MRRPKTRPGRRAAGQPWPAGTPPQQPGKGISQPYPAAVALLRASEAALTARTATGDTAATARRRSEPQIGAELFISARTASVRVSNILAKLGVTSRGEAAAAAHRLRLLHPAPEPLQQLMVILGREPQIGPKALPAVSRFE